MANLSYSVTLSQNTTANATDVETKFTDARTWLNNRDNATDFWLNLKVAASVSNPVEFKSSAVDCEVDIDCTGSSGTPRISWRRSGTTYFTAGVDGADSNKFKLGTSGLTTTPALVGNTSTGAMAVRGTATNDSGAASYMGEYIESTITSQTSVGTNSQYFDATSISLTAGDWDVSGCIWYDVNSATFTTVADFEIGISVTTGNSSTGLTSGVNYIAVQTTAAAFPTNGVASVSIPVYRVSLASTTTHYLKGLVANYTAGTPKYRCRLSARRVR